MSICKEGLKVATIRGAELVAGKPYSFSRSIKGQKKNLWTISFLFGGITKKNII